MSGVSIPNWTLFSPDYYHIIPVHRYLTYLTLITHPIYLLVSRLSFPLTTALFLHSSVRPSSLIPNPSAYVHLDSDLVISRICTLYSSVRELWLILRYATLILSRPAVALRSLTSLRLHFICEKDRLGAPPHCLTSRSSRYSRQSRQIKIQLPVKPTTFIQYSTREKHPRHDWPRTRPAPFQTSCSRLHIPAVLHRTLILDDCRVGFHFMC